MNIRFTIDLRQYFRLREDAKVGNLYIVIDEKERLEIIGQQGWDKEFYIFPIPSRDMEETRLFQLWLLSEWEKNSARKIQDAKKSEVKQLLLQQGAKAFHEEQIAKEQKAIKFLTEKGMSRSESLRIIENAKNPRKVITTDFDMDTLEEIKVESINETDLKFQKLFGFDTLSQ